MTCLCRPVSVCVHLKTFDCEDVRSFGIQRQEPHRSPYFLTVMTWHVRLWEHMAEESLLKDLEKRIEKLDEQQKKKAKETGQKNDKAAQLREQLCQLDREREAKLEELAAKERALPYQQPSSRSPSAPAASRASAEARSGASRRSSEAAAASTGAGAAGAAGASTSVDATTHRSARILLGACMPAFLSARTVLHQVNALYENLCMFADVRLIVMNELVSANDALGYCIHDKVEMAARRNRGRLGLDSGASTEALPDAKVFSLSDQRLNPHHCAAELARWADVLLIAPMCTSTLSGIAIGREDDLLLEVVQLWGSIKKKGSAGVQYHVPLKPFIISPRVPAEKRNNLLIEKQMHTLDEMGVEVRAAETAQEGWRRREGVHMGMQRVAPVARTASFRARCCTSVSAICAPRSPLDSPLDSPGWLHCSMLAGDGGPRGRRQQRERHRYLR